MYQYFEAITNTKGDVLSGYYVGLVDTTTGLNVPIYSDASSTPISVVSGLSNKARVDINGNVTFYVVSGTYHLEIYGPDGNQKINRIQSVPMIDATSAAQAAFAAGGGLPNVNTNVGTFGSGTQIPVVNLDAKGRVLSASVTSLASALQQIAALSPSEGQVLQFVGGVWTAATIGTVIPTVVLAPLTAISLTQGSAFTRTFTASGGTAPYTFVMTGIPAGMAQTGSTGLLSGTPTGTGAFSITVKAVDANGYSSIVQTFAGGIAAAGSAVARSAATIARTSANTIPPSPTFSINRPIDWADGDQAVARWSSTDDMASPTEGTPITLAAATTSLDLINPDLTSGPKYIEIAAWSGTRPGSLNWSNRIGAGDSATPTITSANTATAYQNIDKTITVTASKGGSVLIVGGADQSYFSASGMVLTFVGQPTARDYIVQIQVVSYAGVASATQTLTLTNQVNTPSAFTFTDVSNATLSTLYTSNTITIAGLATGSSVACSITGGTYSKNGGAYTSAAGTVTNGDGITLRVTSSSAANSSNDVVFTVGATSDTYTVATPGSSAKLAIGSGSTGAGTDRSQYIDSTDGLTATVNASTGAPNLIKSPNAPPTKSKFEISLSSFAGSILNIGVTDSTRAVGAAVFTRPGSGGNGAGFTLEIAASGGTVQTAYFNGTSTGVTLPVAAANGQIISVETDSSAGTVLIKHKSGSTVTTLGTYTLTSQIPTNYRAFVGGYNASDSVTVNFGATTWAITPTSGFVGW